MASPLQRSRCSHRILGRCRFFSEIITEMKRIQLENKNKCRVENSHVEFILPDFDNIVFARSPSMSILG